MHCKQAGDDNMAFDLLTFVCVFTAYWDATRAFMILSLLACFFGIIFGIMAFIHYSSFDRFDKTFAAGILFFISCKLTFLLVLFLILKKWELFLIQMWYFVSVCN